MTCGYGIKKVERHDLHQARPTLRNATAADRQTLIAFMQGLRRDDPMPDQSPATELQSIAAMDELIADESLGRIWIVELDRQAVGYAALTFVHSIEFGGRCAFVDELYVAPQHRGYGVGRQALEAIVIESHCLNVGTLLLEVSPKNERAIGLYQSAGFAARTYNLLFKRLEQMP